MDVAQTPGWDTCIVGLDGERLSLSRLSFVCRSMKDWTDFAVAGWLVAVSAMSSVIRFVCSYALRDSRAWKSVVFKWWGCASMDDSQMIRPGRSCGQARSRGISQCASM